MTEVARAQSEATVAGSRRTAPARQGAPSTGSPDTSKQHRLDIQALRAVAVLGVVTYHLFPGALPGGFVGVDVFFVISGFLITSHLLSRPPQRLADFGRFWSRRALRLLPPVGAVILTTLGGGILFMSPGQWKALAREAITSMLYVQNWQLVSESTDYLDAQRAVSPFQHFWSLSVEEQYYVAWPIVVGALTWCAVRSGRSARALVGWGFVIAVAASFGWGLAQTYSAPAVAYFSTWTRMWELGIGSLLAATYPVLLRRLEPSVRITLFWGGVVGIATAFAVITVDTPFPGYAALLPTLATAAVILATDPGHAGNPRWLTRSAPVQLIGDCSYALYLWHWPLIVIAPYALGHDTAWWDKVVLLVLALLLAWGSTTFLEGPVRGSSWLRARLRRVFVMSLAITALVVVAGVALTAHTNSEIAAASAKVEKAITSGRPCFGAGAMDPAHDCPRTDKLITSPEFAKDDYSDGITDKKCLNWPPYHETPVVCHRGDITDPVKRVALFGNSHAGQWVEAMSKIGRQNHWQVDTYIVGSCYSTFDPNPSFCDDIMSDSAAELLAGKYDLVVMSTLDRADSSSAEMYEPTVRRAAEDGGAVLVIRDTPAPADPTNVTPDCVAAHLDDFGACAGRPRKWIGVDYLTAAAKRVAKDDDRVFRVNLNKYLCRRGTCPAVIGGVIPYRDENHLTVTFAQSLVPYLTPAVERALSGSS
ncbi:acyltransferase [Nocardioides anomalus]|uniref:Acyltransferase n=1 Tax=Nocardioides anomalus TaxID=2712223 RepID=A0A6G6WHW3_9ACTN|nr:acyltransferase family protein [Nocardioides anomalus]QIG44796.1 acyltransferase [Nocardioides anomalus]